MLCLLALVVSVAAAVLTNIAKSQDDDARLSTAEAANAELEGLATLLQFGDLSVEDGVKLYQQYAVKIPFVEDLAPTMPRPGSGRLGSAVGARPERARHPGRHLRRASSAGPRRAPAGRRTPP